MTEAEFGEAMSAAIKRNAAVLDGDESKTLVGTDQFAMFAGTDLPGPLVLGVLESEAANLARYVVRRDDAFLLMKAMAVNAFWIGFECGRRS